MTYADVVAGVQATLAAYAHALDDGRTDDVVALFCADGVADMQGIGTYEGHEGLRAAYAGFVPVAPQRHLVMNTHVTAWSDDAAEAISDFVFVVKADAGWSIGVVGRYHDTLRLVDGAWRFGRRAITFGDAR